MTPKMIKLAAADCEIVTELALHLVNAFQKYANQKAAQSPEGLRYVDGLMGCHNFYKAIIHDLERRIKEDGKSEELPPDLLRKIAVSTLAQSLGVES